MKAISLRAAFCFLLATLYGVLAVGALPVVLCIADNHTAVEWKYHRPHAGTGGTPEGLALSGTGDTCQDVQLGNADAAARDRNLTTSTVKVDLIPVLDLAALLAPATPRPANQTTADFGDHHLLTSARSLRSVILLV